MNIIEKLNDIQNSKINISATIQEKGINLSGIPLSGYSDKIMMLDNTSGTTATADKILSNYTAYSNRELISGSIQTVDQPAPSISTSNGNINAEYIPINGYVENINKKITSITATSLDVNLKNYNIINGITIFGVTGSALSGVDTFDATADPSNLLLGKTAYVKGTKITGSIETYSGPYTYNSSTSTQVFQLEGKYLSGNITINPLNTTSITSPIVQQGTNAGTLKVISKVESSGVVLTTTKQDDNILLSAIDNKFNVQNIKSGIQVFGIQGTFTNDANAVASSILSGYSAYISGQLIEGTAKEYIPTSSATASSDKILSGYSAFVNDKLISGTIQTYSGNTVFQPTRINQTIYVASKYVTTNLTINKMSDAEILDPTITVGQTPGTIIIQHKINYDGFVNDQILTDYNVTLSNVDNKFNAANIKAGINMFGINGTFTSDANADADNILSGKTAYVNGTKITGNIQTITLNNPTINQNSNVITATYTATKGYNSTTQTLLNTYVIPSATLEIPQFEAINGKTITAYYTPISGYNGDTTRKSASKTLTDTQIQGMDSNLIAANIKSGINMFGVNGTFTSDANAEAMDLLSGKIAYVNGTKITGSIQNVTLTTPSIIKGSAGKINITTNVSNSGYINITSSTFNNISLTDIENNLTAENIASGVSMFGITGTHQGGIDTGEGTITANTVLNGYIGFAKGNRIVGNIETITLNQPSISRLSNQISVSYTVDKGYNPSTQTLSNTYVIPSATLSNPQFEAINGKTITAYYIPTSGYNGDTRRKSASKTLTDEQIRNMDSNLIAANIKSGQTIFGINGTFTSDANAAASSILQNYSAYVKGNKINGSIQTVSLNNPTINQTNNIITSTYTVAKGYNSENSTQTTTYTIPSGSLGDAVVIADKGTLDITSKIIIPGYLGITSDTTNVALSSIDADFKAENIKAGVGVLGVVGTFTFDANATSGNILSGYSAYVNGNKINGTHVCPEKQAIINQTINLNTVLVKVNQGFDTKLKQSGVWLTPVNDLNKHYCISGLSNSQTILSGIIQCGQYFVGVIGNEFNSLKYSQDNKTTWVMMDRGLPSASNYKDPYITFSLNKKDNPLQSINVIPGTLIVKVGQLMVGGPGIDLVLSGVTSLDDLINQN